MEYVFFLSPTPESKMIHKILTKKMIHKKILYPYELWCHKVCDNSFTQSPVHISFYVEFSQLLGLEPFLLFMWHLVPKKFHSSKQSNKPCKNYFISPLSMIWVNNQKKMLRRKEKEKKDKTRKQNSQIEMQIHNYRSHFIWSLTQYDVYYHLKGTITPQFIFSCSLVPISISTNKKYLYRLYSIDRI